MNLDHIITGNWGHDHPDNQVCPECGLDADYHCQVCKGCLGRLEDGTCQCQDEED